MFYDCDKSNGRLCWSHAQGGGPQGSKAKDQQLFQLANCVRALAIDAVEKANSGHPGAPMGMADAAAVLFAKHLKFDAANPDWPDRDRFVLSNGRRRARGKSLAGHLRLNKLIVLYDDNSISIDGATSLSFSDDIPAKAVACGWRVASVDGHDAEAVDAAIAEARAATDQPTLIALKTVIGYGAPKKAGTAAAHGAPLGPEEAAAAKAALG